MTTGQKPSLTSFELPDHWQVHSEGSRPDLCRTIQRMNSADKVAVNVFLDATNGGGIGWIHPWGGPDRPLYCHGVKVLDFAFPMQSFYDALPRIRRIPPALDDWLEAQIDGWARREQEQEGLPPLDE